MMYSTKTLELSHILTKIAQFSFGQKTKEIIENLTPSVDMKQITYDLKSVNQLVKLYHDAGSLPFFEQYDCYDVLKRLKQVRRLSIEDFLALKNLLVMEQKTKRFQTQINPDYDLIYTQIDQLVFHEEGLKAIQAILNEYGEIFDHASTTLSQLRKSIRHKQNQLDKLMTDLLVKYGSYLNESLVLMRNGRYVIPVKETYKNKVKGVIHDLSASKQTIYIEPDDIRQVTTDIEYLNAQEKEEIDRILAALTKVLAPMQLSLLENLDKLVVLDVYHAKAKYAQMIDAILPALNEEGVISFKQARHPLIDPKQVVAIDVELNQKQKILMITGPNTGGKTVALKTVGLLTLMIGCGILIPVEPGSKAAVFKTVFADIGDEQSIIQNLSTFSSHLTKIKKMLDQLDDQQLILLDEIGSGTDPHEGVALAIAILEALKKYDLRIMVTTHYSELKLYAYEHDDILSASVAFDEATLKPLYRLQLGISGNSHALKIAQRLGLNQDVVSHAQDLLLGRQSDLAKQIEKLSAESTAVEKHRIQLIEDEKKLQSLIQSYEIKLLNFEQEKDKQLEKIRQKEEKRLNKLQVEARSLIEELSQKQTLSTPEAAKLKHQLKRDSDQNEDVNEPLQVDDKVYIKPYQQEGQIMQIKKNQYTVSFGQFEMNFKITDLMKIQQTEKTKKQRIVKKNQDKTQTPSIQQAKMELDLRGYRFEDVKEAMDQAIDRALLSNLSQLRIIHGFGTGAVRKAVYAYIKQSVQIKTSRYGGEGEGLNGVTIITLK